MFAATPRELGHIQDFAERYPELSLTTLTRIEHQGFEMPLQRLSMGSQDPTAPCLILTGSIHGVERIGSQIILAFIKSLLKRRHWDSQLNDTLNKIQVLTVPVVNPWGVTGQSSRCRFDAQCACYRKQPSLSALCRSNYKSKTPLVSRKQ